MMDNASTRRHEHEAKRAEQHAGHTPKARIINSLGRDPSKTLSEKQADQQQGQTQDRTWNRQAETTRHHLTNELAAKEQGQRRNHRATMRPRVSNGKANPWPRLVLSY